MSYKFCNQFGMWCDEVEDILPVEDLCDMDCENCEHAEEVKRV